VDSANPSVGPILQLNFNTAGNNDTSTSGLIADLANNQLITIRGAQNFKFNNVIDTNPTRPSTALTFLGDAADDASAPVYRVIAYNTKSSLGTNLSANQSILTFDSTYNYIQISVKKDRVNTVDSLNAGKTLGYTAGDVRIAIDKIESTKDNARLNTGQMLFAWDGKVHRVVSYTNPGVSFDYAIITISDVSSTGSPLTDLNTVKIAGLHSSLHSTTNTSLNADQTVILKPGLAKTEEASVVIKISTMRATGHDFLDVGTGGYNASNYPNRIYGAPLTPKSQSNEVQERTRGRVFYVSTDQDGFFRVGRFFTVDQGTGTVKFAASIALSNLDGLGFKRGVAISEFSTDDVFLNPATDVVPVQQAIYNYLNKRLGMNDKGANVDSIGPGFLDRQGINGPKNDIDWKGYNIIGLPTVDDLSPISAATNKNYVDIETVKFSELDRLKNVVLTSPKRADILSFVGALNGAVNAEVVGDLTATLVSPITTKLKIAIGTVSISSLTVEDASLFPDQGYVQIGQEFFRYSTRTTRANPLLAFGATGTEKLDGITRLSLSTTKNAKFTTNDVAVSHYINELVVSLNKSQIDLQINPDTIIDADVNSKADILQSKLKLNLAQIKLAAPIGTDAAKQAENGLSSFNSSNFTATDGWVSIKTGGVTKSNIENIASNTLLGNLEATAASPAELPIEDVYKRTIWNLFATNDLNTNYSLTFVLGSTQAASTFSSTEISNTVTNNSIIKRSSNGSIKVSKIDTNGGVTIISASGSSDNATPVAYKGQWKPEFNATLTATDLAGGAAGSLPYQTAVGTTSMLGIGPVDTVLSSNGSTLFWGPGGGGGGTVTSKTLSITLRNGGNTGLKLPITLRDSSTTNISITNNSLAVTLRDSSIVNLTVSNNLLPVTLRNGTSSTNISIPASTSISVTNDLVAVTLRNSSIVNLTISNNLLAVTLHNGSTITNVNITVSQNGTVVSSVKLPITLHDGSTINLTLRSV
jgi:hypothetical protein